MSSENPTTNLGLVLRRWRVNEGLSLREAAKQIGLGAASTLMRVEHGHTFDAETAHLIWGWMLRHRADGGQPRQRKATA